MTLLTEMGVLNKKQNEFAGLKYIPVDAASQDIYNPVVCRAMRISFRILNALLKKYGEFDEVVIEMPRDRNSDEKRKRINDGQKLNEKEMEYIEKKLVSVYDLAISPSDFSAQKQLSLKLKLWNEQDGKCLYSGREIDPKDIIENPDLFEIDHIIPRSISFDDSRSNKVLVYRTENQNKGNQTPYYYLTHSKNNWSYEQFEAMVINLSKKKEYGISRKKVENLLNDEDITKIEVLKGFINRNINDTRYASRVVLNTVQSFFNAKQCDTKIKVIRGSYTHQMRINMKLDKKREESYSHHAVDAMLIGYSQLGYEAYRRLQGEFIDFETGEILNKQMWNDKMSDEVYKEYLYGIKWSNIRNEITRAEKNVKYWYYVDRKCNRNLSKQTIRATRTYDGEIYKVNKLDIRSKEGFNIFKNLAFSSYESDKEKLLIYRYDKQTFDDLIRICLDYADTSNPFVAYERESGDYVRKYAKKHNGPRINKLKYTDGKVDSCLDVSHKYGYVKGCKKVILEDRVPYRMDVYYNEIEGIYYFVDIRQVDIKFENGKHMIDEEAYAEKLLMNKMIDDKETREDLGKHGYIYKFTFYRNDIIEYEKNGKFYRERLWSKVTSKTRNHIETKPLNKEAFEKRKKIGLGKTNQIRKYNMDILGNLYLCEQEEFSKYC